MAGVSAYLMETNPRDLRATGTVSRVVWLQMEEIYPEAALGQLGHNGPHRLAAIAWEGTTDP